jgi:hypothetical protein
MKKIFVILMTSVVLFSCNNDNLQVIETHELKIVDSVEYHPIGSDNTLQTTPYWKVRLVGETVGIRSYRKYNVGDTIEVIKKVIKKIKTKTEYDN